MRIERTLGVVAAIATLVSLLPMPYGFYSVTRVVFTICCAVVAHKLFKKNNYLWLIGFGLVILYNPLFPIHLGSKVLWTVINVSTVGFIFSVSNDKSSKT